MPYQTYSLSRFINDDLDHGTSVTIDDDDAINCAHMLAAGFNAMSRNMLGDFALAVVDTKAGTVQYDGKIEQIKRAEPHVYEQTFTFEPSQGNADTILTLFGSGETPTFTASGKMSFAEPSKYAHVNRDVLESAYGELEAVRAVLFDAGVETIPADEGVRELVRLNEQLPAAAQDIAEQWKRNAAARAELIEYVKREFALAAQYDEENRLASVENAPNVEPWKRGARDVLARFLVAIGETDADDAHAYVDRLIGDE